MHRPFAHSGAGVGARPRLSDAVRIHWRADGRTCEIVHPSGNAVLNKSAGEILTLCNGTRELDGIIGELEARFHADGLAADVHRFLDEAQRRGWLD